ncbi:hypothetical protein [Nocardia otitidiscaviarum]|uniref:hypothetical protein n=1 Tax=Nocardia otitidiscaviarum TaxID=1823 RepID=UPI0004A6E44B|nr:hypothetical protein [Nocardia otitidiscaviarum]
MSIWEDDDFLDLSPAAQHLYFVLATDPSMSYCGRVDWRPARLTTRAAGWSRAAIDTAATELEQGRFVLFDPDTEEALVRAFIRSDELLRNPKMGVSVVKAYGSVASRTLRAAVVTEVVRVHCEHPEYSSWSSQISGEPLARLLAKPGLDSVGYTNRITNQIGNQIGNADPVAIGDSDPVQITDPDTNHIGNADRSTSYLHTAYSNPHTYNPQPQPAQARAVAAADIPATTSRPGARESTTIPSDWQPNDAHRHKANRSGIDLDHEADQFRHHALANGRTQVDWNAAFHTWLGRAKPRANNNIPKADQKLMDLAARTERLLRERNQPPQQSPLLNVIDGDVDDHRSRETGVA